MGNKFRKSIKLPCVSQEIVILEEFCVTVKEIKIVESDWIAFYKPNARNRTSFGNNVGMLQSSNRPQK